jgi:hypothetical protein
MPDIETNREWQQLLAEYTQACAAFDAANRVILSLPADGAAALTLGAAEAAEDIARERLITVRRKMRDLDGDYLDALPIG